MKKKLLTIALFCFALVKAQDTPLAQINIDLPQMICNPGECTLLTAQPIMPKSTNSYSVAHINYNPMFPFYGGTVIPPNGDDYWSPVFNLPFTFNFYGNSYNSLLVGTNGVITFDLNNNHPLDFCEYTFNQTIPNVSFPIKNAIYGVYQDTDVRTPPVTNPNVQNINYYVVDTGVFAAPNRAFIVNFNQLPQYDCNSNVGYQSSQIVIHEGTNIVEVLVQNRTSCPTWNNGSGLIGLQNQTGTLAITPTDRNTGTWSASNEAWRFTPNGPTVPVSYQWLVDGFVVPGWNSNSATICPTENGHVYSIQASYQESGSTITVQDDLAADLIVNSVLMSPMDISVCSNSTGIYMANIDQSNEVLNGENPADYEIKYYQTFIDAQNGTNNFITVPFSYSFAENQIIYMRIENMTTGCAWIKLFALNIIPPVAPPTGEANQGFSPGQTLNDLVVQGQNIQWYDAAEGGNSLPTTTILQNDTTYYASQTVNNCESRMSNTVRLAVHVYDVTMANAGFNLNHFKVYPNPAHQVLNVSNNQKIDVISARNSLGQKVLEVYPNQTDFVLNLAQLSAGVYFVELKSQAQSQTIKLIKN